MLLEISWECEGKKGVFNYKWSGDHDGAEYYFTEGNLSCDCNLSYETGIDVNNEWPCGDRIKVTGIKDITNPKEAIKIL